MLQCYYGTGKGKTTAAVGQAIRMKGAGYQVLFIQFLKDGQSSEIPMLEKCGIKVVYKKMPQLFIDMHDPQMIKEVSQLENELFDLIDEKYDGIILDELLDVISLNLINEGKVYDRLLQLKKNHEVILTGRMPNHKIKVILDYSSEIKKHKHPYDQGVKARKGIEF
ncbi:MULTISPECIES: cob(I)yrinic acid a,c-diamide adenosyltransferase [Coprobacillaceae]|uniref:cob(I)yrinic acid a,c-diamide adenosyltransferase n=1 Tax=Coprobacillaceae TaxID=2810280 RepID=UPI000E4E96B9|nr:MULTISPECIES: cob(I)yrinic acid a,c-diamide adenosyltransferase [Coprobacillaceae]RHM59479.1 cob(I)yrinic acid a c-diamide adenosyltransferase [Coprobacillus sp. AF33-1AC]RHS91550.1 cob(I)yrinic acid a c-diamide adenosyltransferase [Erysipelatoclostridium sp. AM42-17]